MLFYALESGIDVGPEKFGKKNKRITRKCSWPMEKVQNFNKRGAFNKAVGNGK